MNSASITRAAFVLVTCSVALRSQGMTLVRQESRPSAVDGIALCYDESRLEGLLFGGRGGTDASFDETWTWDGRRWREHQPATVPPDRQYACMAWDPKQKCVLMFGGVRTLNYGPIYSDTWLWDGTDWRLAATNGPQARAYARMATDYLRNRVVLFGGVGANGTLGDTWEWDGTAWLQIAPQGRIPHARHSQSMAWNPVTNRVAMFGGYGSPVGSLGLVPAEEWDGSAWTQIVGSGGAQPAPGSIAATAVPDPLGRGVLLYGPEVFSGSNPPPPIPRQYLWSGGRLQVLAPSTPMPLRAMYETVFLDKTNNEVVAYGGIGFGHEGRDVWVQDLYTQAWKPRDQKGVGSLGVGALVHAPWRDEFLFVDSRNETWWQSENGQTYSAHGPTYLGNDLQCQFIADTQRSLLYAYYHPFGALFVHQGAQWTEIPRSQHGLPTGGQLLFDPRDGQFFVLRSGLLSKWNGSSTVALSTVPTNRFVSGLALDLSRNVLSILETLNNANQVAFLHEWDGIQWRTHTCPPAGYRSQYSWSPEFGCLLLADFPNMMLWKWDGQSWQQVVTSSGLPRGQDRTPYWVSYDACRMRNRYLLQQRPTIFRDQWDLVQETLVVGPAIPAPGDVLSCQVTAPQFAGNPWFLLYSQSSWPGIPLAGLQPNPHRRLPLRLDDLFLASLSSGIRGALDPQGRGSATIVLPNNPSMIGFEFHVAAMTLAPSMQVGLVSNPVRVHVRR